jgi:hypothetical protein
MNYWAEPIYTHPEVWLLLALEAVTLVHVYRQSRKDARIGHPWLHVCMVMLVLWPLSYLFWLLWWPGALRQALFGSDRKRAEEWARRRLEEQKNTRAPNHGVEATRR